jgi:anhydro-N-acetylmuramic acid kinase
LLAQQGLAPADITAIGCHGQTVRHAPEAGYSIQLADWARLAELSGIFTIGDFRSRDLAAGGQGAPLVPAFHEALFHSPHETRVVLNIGGIANISVLPDDAPAFGFDTGPGNMLMDAWVQHVWQQPYDADGAKAAQGRVLPDLLAALLAHPYFALPHPKSTGRELFSLAWLHTHLNGAENAHDVLRTLLEYSAQSIAQAIDSSAPCRAASVCVRRRYPQSGADGAPEHPACAATSRFTQHRRTAARPAMGGSRRLRLARRLLDQPHPRRHPPRHRRTQTLHLGRRPLRLSLLPAKP